MTTINEIKMIEARAEALRALPEAEAWFTEAFGSNAERIADAEADAAYKTARLVYWTADVMVG